MLIIPVRLAKGTDFREFEKMLAFVLEDVPKSNHVTQAMAVCVSHVVHIVDCASLCLFKFLFS